MKRTYRYDADMDCLVEIGGNSNYYEPPVETGPNLIRDNLPGGINGMLSHADARIYDSKSKYLREVKARGYEVVGNDTKERPKPQTPHREYQQAAADAYYGRYNREPHEKVAYEQRNRKG